MKKFYVTLIAVLALCAVAASVLPTLSPPERALTIKSGYLFSSWNEKTITHSFEAGECVNVYAVNFVTGQVIVDTDDGYIGYSKVPKFEFNSPACQ